MAKLVVLYGHPRDPAAFEEYYAKRHLPFASENMPRVTDAENLKILGSVPDSNEDDHEAPYYRISQMTYDNVEDLRAGISSQQGTSVLADLENFATGGATVLIADE